MARVFEGERTFLHPVLRPLERAASTSCRGVREDVEQRWTHYAGALLAFTSPSSLFVYLIQRLQGLLPLNPQGFSTAHAPANATPMTPDLAFNTAVSFMTNTNWQSYVGETTMSYFVQMAALAVQNFMSAAAGIAVAIALIRGFARQRDEDDRQLLGRPDARARSTSCCRSRSSRRCSSSRRASIQNFDPYTQVHDGGRRDADHRAGAGGVAGSDQEARHQRRRILQRQLGASVREPDAADQPACRCS